MLITEAIERLQKHMGLYGDQEMVFVTPNNDGEGMTPYRFMVLTEMADECVVLLNES